MPRSVLGSSRRGQPLASGTLRRVALSRAPGHRRGRRPWSRSRRHGHGRPCGDIGAEARSRATGGQPHAGRRAGLCRGRAWPGCPGHRGGLCVGLMGATRRRDRQGLATPVVPWCRAAALRHRPLPESARVGAQPAAGRLVCQPRCAVPWHLLGVQARGGREALGSGKINKRPRP